MKNPAKAGWWVRRLNLFGLRRQLTPTELMLLVVLVLVALADDLVLAQELALAQELVLAVVSVLPEAAQAMAFSYLASPLLPPS